MTIGQKIKQLRESFGLSRIDLAERIGVSNDTIWRWENDFTEPKLINVICIADFFGISLDDLVGRFKCKCKRKEDLNDGRTKDTSVA